MILEYILLSFIVLNIYIIFNLYIKNSKLKKITKQAFDYNNKLYEHFLRISEVIKFSDNKLNEVDAKGSFKSNDEVGFFFVSLQAIQSVLNQFKIDYNEYESGLNKESKEKKET